MAAETNVQEKLVSYLHDAHAMEQNVLRMLDSMIRTTEDAEIRQELEHHKDETEEQRARLRARLEALGEDTSKVKDVGAVVGALVKGVADIARSDKAGKNARDAFMTEHLEIASYELLERLALRAGDEETAAVARHNRLEEEEMARKIAANWDTFLEMSLRE